MGKELHFKKRPLDKRRGLEDTREQLAAGLLRDAEKHINSNYGVEKLCKGAVNERMQQLMVKQGDRLTY